MSDLSGIKYCFLHRTDSKGMLLPYGNSVKSLDSVSQNLTKDSSARMWWQSGSSMEVKNTRTEKRLEKCDLDYFAFDEFL